MSVHVGAFGKETLYEIPMLFDEENGRFLDGHGISRLLREVQKSDRREVHFAGALITITTLDDGLYNYPAAICCFASPYITTDTYWSYPEYH